MRYVPRAWIALGLLALLPCPALPHYHMLLPQSASVKKGETATFTYQWGHPFEHQLFDASLPQELFALTPDGKKIDLGKGAEQSVLTTDKKKAIIHVYKFTPEQRGDYVVCASCPPRWMEEDQEFCQDTVKVVLHVQAQKGWDRVTGQDFEMVPLTRPYGLQSGMVFQAQALAGGKGLTGTLVEIERYNETPPKQMPADEHITRTAKTDPSGVVTCTLTEPGWWCITAQRDGGKKERNGKLYPVKQRATLWVFVDKKPESGPDKKPEPRPEVMPLPTEKRR